MGYSPATVFCLTMNPPRRGETFVSRKITRGVARIKAGLDRFLYLGNLNARRDWGYAPEYVQAMWLMLQQDTPDDFVIATGETHTVQEFVEAAFSCVGLNWHDHVRIDPHYFRPTEVDLLVGDASKARQVLNWTPRVRFQELVRIMVDADVEIAMKGDQGSSPVSTPPSVSSLHVEVNT